MNTILIPYIVQYLWMIASLFFVWNYMNGRYTFINAGIYINVVQGLLLGILTIGAGYKWGRHNLSTDISYGVYLYHMIVINILVVFNLKGVTGFIITFCAATLCGILSSHLLEKPFLKKS